MPIVIIIRIGLNKKGHIKIILVYKCYMLNILESVKDLISSSIANIQETARWQFCRNTQFPDFIASLIILSAIGPCPCPSEIDCTLNSKKTVKCCFILLISNATIKNLNMVGFKNMHTFQILIVIDVILKKSYTMTKWALSQECKDSLISTKQSMWYTTLANWKIKTIWLSQ